MDVFLIIVIFIVFCVLFSICGWCCKKHREGTVHGFVTPTATQVVVPPYPVHNSSQPQPQPMPGFAVGGYQSPAFPVPVGTAYPSHQAGYPPAPYPAGAAPYPPNPPYPVATAAAPYPPPGGAAPYPTHAATQQSPPSYMEAVNQPPAVEGYTKQAPYNPHY